MSRAFSARLILALSGAVSLFAQTSALMPVPRQSPLDNNGHTITGACMYSYASGGTTPQATYNNASLMTANANPMVIDANGRLPAVYLSPVSYKIVFAQRSMGSCPATPGTVMWSQDPVFDTGLQARAALDAEIALLATAAGAGKIGFSQSSTYSAGTVGKKLQQTVSITDPPFNAVCDGSTDTTAAWNAALAFLGSSGGQITIPPGVDCRTATGITINVGTTKYIRIVGGGNSSVISCPAGVTCVSWAGSTTGVMQDQGMANLQISSPAANGSSIGLSITPGGSTPGLGNTRLYFDTIRVSGNGGAPAGTGIKIDTSTLPFFTHLTEQFFDIGIDQIGFSNTWISQCYIGLNASIGWNINAPGDNQAFECDFEGDPIGIKLVGGSANGVTVSQSHFESNATNHFDIGAGTALISYSNSYAGGTGLVNATGRFTSHAGDDLQFTITNNSNGAQGVRGVSIVDPVFPPTLAGTGCASLMFNGVPSLTGPGCANPFDATGYSRYTVDQSFTATGDITATAALHAASSTSSVTLNGSTSCGGSPSIVGSSYTQGYPQTVHGLLTVGSATVACTAKFNLPNSTGPQALWTCGGSDATLGTSMAQSGGSNVGSCSITGTVAAGNEVYFWATAW